MKLDGILGNYTGIIYDGNFKELKEVFGEFLSYKTEEMEWDENHLPKDLVICVDCLDVEIKLGDLAVLTKDNEIKLFRRVGC